MDNSQDRSAAASLFIKAGLSLGVETATFRTELGIFEGSLKDDVIFKYSLQDGFPWSYALQEFLLQKLFVNTSGHGSGTYIDVGANIGLIVIPVAEKGGIQCYAFEPEPDNSLLLERNIRAHRMESLIRTYPIALFSRRAVLPFELSSRNHGDHRIRPGDEQPRASTAEGEAMRNVIKVRAEKLDDLLDPRQLQKPIVVKVDIQGAEVQFFRGAYKMLPFMDYVVLEYWPYGILYFGDELESLIQIIAQFPFAAVVGLVDRVRSVNVELEPVDRAINKIREAVPSKLDPDLEINIVCSRQPVFPGDLMLGRE